MLFTLRYCGVKVLSGTDGENVRNAFHAALEFCRSVGFRRLAAKSGTRTGVLCIPGPAKAIAEGRIAAMLQICDDKAGNLAKQEVLCGPGRS